MSLFNTDSKHDQSLILVHWLVLWK